MSTILQWLAVDPPRALGDFLYVHPKAKVTAIAGIDDNHAIALDIKYNIHTLQDLMDYICKNGIFPDYLTDQARFFLTYRICNTKF